MKKKILVIHGPNLSLLGKRETNIYGKLTISSINQSIKKLAQTLKIAVDIVQTDYEGDIVKRIGSAPQKYTGVIINPAGYTHTSVAIRDAVLAVQIPVIEVHISNVYKREEFRHKSLIAPACLGQISGLGLNSYLLAMRALAS